jgi:hypothetical protein
MTLPLILSGAMALLINAPTPSVVDVTWKGFGSQLDYRSYNYICNSNSYDY